MRLSTKWTFTIIANRISARYSPFTLGEAMISLSLAYA